uniref:Uncharacterized protein n=1 Tax=Oryza sativa subsp. japonica TaxID=39947 RepID=Q6ZLG6_ORYSJ|nr:hypothetical protein [Oryza sativa Japonica Group]
MAGLLPNHTFPIAMGHAFPLLPLLRQDQLSPERGEDGNAAGEGIIVDVDNKMEAPMYLDDVMAPGGQLLQSAI